MAAVAVGVAVVAFYALVFAVLKSINGNPWTEHDADNLLYVFSGATTGAIWRAVWRD